MARITVAASLLALTLVVAGCGSDGDGSSVTLPSSVSLPERSTTTGSAPEETSTTDTSRPPVTRPETTEAPVTEPETTVPPATETPTTARPPISRPATTEPETTTTASTDEEAAAEETTTTVSVPGEEGADDGSETVWWPWALIAALVALLIGLLLVRRSRGKAAIGARTDAALGRAADVATHLAVVVPANAQAMAAQETGQLASLAAELDAVAAEGSDERRSAGLRRVSAQARTLHQVADGVALSPGPPSEEATEQLRAQAALLHTVTTEVGAELQPAP